MAELTALEWQKRAISETGGSALNAVFEFAVLYETDGGTLTIEFNGHTGTPLVFPFGAAALKANLEANPFIGVGGVKVSGARGGPFTVEMIGDNAGQDVPAFVVNGELLEPPQEVETEVVQYGEIGDFDAAVADYWNDHEAVTDAKLRFLKTKVNLIELRLGQVADAVDTRTGQVNELDRKESQRVGNLERMLARTVADMNKREAELQAGARRTFGGVMNAGKRALEKWPNAYR